MLNVSIILSTTCYTDLIKIQRPSSCYGLLYRSFRFQKSIVSFSGVTRILKNSQSGHVWERTLFNPTRTYDAFEKFGRSIHEGHRKKMVIALTFNEVCINKGLVHDYTKFSISV